MQGYTRLLAACVAGVWTAFAASAAYGCQTPGFTQDVTISAAGANYINNQLAQNLNVAIVTTATKSCGHGQRANGPGNIIIKAPIIWSTHARLTIQAWHGVTIARSMVVSGTGRLVISYNGDGTDGSLRFSGANTQSNGHNIVFTDVVGGDTQGLLIINGSTYTLVNSIAQLSSAATANPSGHIALADSYDALGDGTYTNAPVQQFAGTFEGLGNTISNLTMSCTAGGNSYGLISILNAGGMVRDVGMIGAHYDGGTSGVFIGGLVGTSFGGTVLQSFARGGMVINESGSHGEAGGLVAENRNGTISLSFAAGTITGGLSTLVGGLAGGNTGTIERSYAKANVSCTTECYAGALAGENRTGGGAWVGTIINSYAVGSATAGAEGYAGGLLGGNGVFDTSGPVSRSYSTAAVSGGSGTEAGGLIGHDSGATNLSYWNTDTAGQSSDTGSPGDEAGITGMTTAELLGALPTGLDPSVWAHASGVNGGLPYLIDLQPH